MAKSPWERLEEGQIATQQIEGNRTPALSWQIWSMSRGHVGIQSLDANELERNPKSCSIPFDRPIVDRIDQGKAGTKGETTDDSKWQQSLENFPQNPRKKGEGNRKTSIGQRRICER